MRPGLFDESKIIKKEDIEKESLNNPILTNDDQFVDNKQIPDEIINTEPADIIVEEQPEIKQTTPTPVKQKVVKSQPVFIFERDKETKEVKTVGKIKNTIIDVDIPTDQLTLIYVNTIKVINEIKVNLEVLKILISESQDNSYYINSQKELMLQLAFNNKKLEILEQLIK